MREIRGGGSPVKRPRRAAPTSRIQSETMPDVYKRKYHGAGLGLTLVRSFAELHGGTVAIDSAPGCGTTVTVMLPESRAVAAAA
ncbi:MAG TPA: ATP-binding protein [Alphaproteobacteria bacterium]